MAPAPVSKVARPAPEAWRIVPFWVMLFAPVALTVSVPDPREEVPRMIESASLTVTLLAPLLFKLTAPVN